MLTLNAAAMVAAVHDPWSYAALLTVLVFMHLTGRGPRGRS